MYLQCSNPVLKLPLTEFDVTAADDSRVSRIRKYGTIIANDANSDFVRRAFDAKH